MLAGTFQQKIRSLNKNLVFMAVENKDKPVALYYKENNDLRHICGTDRDDVPEFSLCDRKGHILKSGWRRTVELLIGQGLVSRYRAQKLFGAVFDKRHGEFVIDPDPIQKAINDFSKPTKTGIEMKRDDIMDISKAIREKEYAFSQ